MSCQSMEGAEDPRPLALWLTQPLSNLQILC